MAHNEEHSIERGVQSALSQEEPRGYFVKVVVVANGCTDRRQNTEVIFKTASNLENEIKRKTRQEISTQKKSYSGVSEGFK